MCVIWNTDVGCVSVLYTEILARGQTESFQNVGGGGGKGVYNVLTFQKSGGARAHLGGKMSPLLPLNETLHVEV